MLQLPDLTKFLSPLSQEFKTIDLSRFLSPLSPEFRTSAMGNKLFDLSGTKLLSPDVGELTTKLLSPDIGQLTYDSGQRTYQVTRDDSIYYAPIYVIHSPDTTISQTASKKTASEAQPSVSPNGLPMLMLAGGGLLIAMILLGSKKK